MYGYRWVMCSLGCECGAVPPWLTMLSPGMRREVLTCAVSA
jgi:hypothetical protein